MSDSNTENLAEPLTDKPSAHAPSFLLQWLRREATRRVCQLIVRNSSSSLFCQHLEALIWPCLKLGVRVPRDFQTISDAIEAAPSWPPSSILVSAGEYKEHLIIDKPLMLVGIDGPVIRGIADHVSARPLLTFSWNSPTQTAPATTAHACEPEIRGFRLVCEMAAHICVEIGCPLISDCHIETRTAFGLLVKRDARPTVKHCHFAGAAISHVLCQDSGAGFFSNNTFDGCQGGAGVLIRGTARPILETNTFQCFKAMGVVLKDESKAILRGNVFRNSPGCGIIVRGTANAKVEANSFTAHRMPAITFQDKASGEVCNNTFENNFGLGILIHSAATACINENRFVKNGAPPSTPSGSSAATADAVISGSSDPSTITSSSSYMLESLQGASSKGIKRAAIAVQGTSKTTIRNNIFEANSGYGVLISQDAFALLEGNTFSGHARPALAIRDQADGMITNNTFSNNRCAIFVLEQSKPTIHSNTFTLHGRDNGILVKDNASPKIEENTFSECTNLKQCMGVHSHGDVTLGSNYMMGQLCPNEPRVDSAAEVNSTDPRDSKRPRVE